MAFSKIKIFGAEPISGENVAFTEAVRAAVKAELAQFACALLAAARRNGSLSALMAPLEDYAKDAAHTCACCEQAFTGECRYWTAPQAEIVTVCLGCHDTLQDAGQRIVQETGSYPGATEKAWEVVRATRVLAFCHTCYGTGFDYPSMMPCPDCAQPNLPHTPAVEPLQAVPAPDVKFTVAPLSVCCKQPTFEVDNRRVCSKCRCTRPL